ncbi:MAG TPA: MarR family winged helix-turn-helix transcriptional regulator [Acidimicrobiales bacterium]|nr:MarR family winged helix-turn-helix transcriptional regulator [Acidimicrobiales bacterium]
MTVEATSAGSNAAASGDAPSPPVAQRVAAVRGAARFSKAMEVVLGEVGLSLPQYRLLLFLSGGPERASALAGSLGVSPPSLTALVDGCVARGLVERVASEEDRRRVLHLITAEGHRALAAGDAALAERLDAIAAHLTPAQAKKLVEGLELMGQGLDALREARRAEQAAAR